MSKLSFITTPFLPAGATKVTCPLLGVLSSSSVGQTTPSLVVLPRTTIFETPSSRTRNGITATPVPNASSTIPTLLVSHETTISSGSLRSLIQFRSKLTLSSTNEGSIKHESCITTNAVFIDTYPTNKTLSILTTLHL